jgi:hypothetical protein
VSDGLRLVLIARLKVTIATPLDVGPVPGGQRRITPITGGRVEGPVLTGEVIAGGADWSLRRADGTVRVWAKYPLLTHDQVVLTVTNTGVITTRRGERTAVTSVAIEAPDGPYAWLNDAVIVGSLAAWPDGPGVSLAFHQVTAAE